jgi:predicted transcriptional regulator
MSTENIDVATDDNNLDLFSADFFSQKTADPGSETEQAKPDEDVEDTDAVVATTTEDTPDQDEDDTLADEPTDDEEEAPEAEAKPKVNKAQERIKELNAKFREQERKSLELEARLNELLAKPQPEQPQTTPIPVQAAKAPEPTDLNEDGTDKYNLGEFDPQYVADLAKFYFKQEAEQDKVRRETEARVQEETSAREALVANWTEKATPAQERYPDFNEKAAELIGAFSDLEKSYDDYLGATIMSMEYGPDVVYYLANHPEEARRIVDSGPTKATIALGRIEARFADAAEGEKPKPRVSKAPTPPPVNKGVATSVTDTPDTDNLDAFEKQFYTKKRA